jgi:hypothetical protein
MITNSTSGQNEMTEEGQLNAESLLSQLSDIVNKCRTLLRDNSTFGGGPKRT